MNLRFSASPLRRAGLLAVMVLGVLAGFGRAAAADGSVIGIYPCWGRLESGQQWTVVVDIDSFEDCQWSDANYQRAIQGAVERVIHRWMVGSGANLTIRFGGFVARGPTKPSCFGTCTQNVGLHEIVLSCDPGSLVGYDGGTALARQAANEILNPSSDCFAGEYQRELDRATIEFFKLRVNGQPIAWVFDNPAAATEYDFQSILMHEFGHALGLAHSCDSSGLEGWLTTPNPTPLCADLSADGLTVAKRQSMYPSATNGWPYNRSAPQTPDLARVKGTYGGAAAMRTDLKLYRTQSTNGTNWSAPTLVQGSAGVRHTPSMAYNWTAWYGHEVYLANIDINGNPFWRWSTDGTGFNNGPTLASMPASDHPPVILAAGTEMLVAAVDRTFDHTAGAGRKMQVRYSSNTGASWTAKPAFQANASYRPDGAVTMLSDGTQIWMLAWQDSESFDGKIALSKDDGQTWFVWTLFPMSDSPGIACTGDNVCQIVFRDAGTSQVNWTRFLARKFTLGLVAGIPIINLDAGGAVALEAQNSHKSGMAPRILVQSVSGTPSFDFHANYGYATSFAWDARVWRKSVANAGYPNTFSYVFPTTGAPHDLLIAKQATLAGTSRILGYVVKP